MSKVSSVLIVEDDFYALNWMELLLRRDWRTRVIEVVGNPVELSNVLWNLDEKFKKIYKELHHEKKLVDVILIDTDIPHDPQWLAEMLRCVEKYSPKSAILFTGVEPVNQIVKLMALPNVFGYVLKDEIRYSLSWAVSLASEYRYVVTPGILRICTDNTPLKSGTLIMDGRKSFSHLIQGSKVDENRVRMMFLFSMQRHEVADEEGISEAYTYGVASSLYDQLRLDDILQGSIDPASLLGDHPIVLDHLKQTLEHLKKTGSKKAKDKETLAFHLLTLPDIS
jgi:hypothetical protein